MYYKYKRTEKFCTSGDRFCSFGYCQKYKVWEDEPGYGVNEPDGCKWPNGMVSLCFKFSCGAKVEVNGVVPGSMFSDPGAVESRYYAKGWNRNKELHLCPSCASRHPANGVVY